MKKKLLLSFLSLFIILNLSVSANASTDEQEKHLKTTTTDSETISEIYISDEDKLNAITNIASTYSLYQDSFSDKYPDIAVAKTAALSDAEKVSISTFNTSGFKQLKYSFEFSPSSRVLDLFFTQKGAVH